MADKKISELTALVSGSVATNDLFVIVDTDANETKKITVSDLTTVVGGTPYTDADVDTHLNTATATTNQVLSWSGTDYDWVAQTVAYTNSDVDSHLNTGTASASEVLSWNGSDYDWVAQTAAYTNTDVDNHLNTGTASASQVLGWNGTDYAWVAQTAAYTNTDVDNHLNTGTATTGQVLSWDGSDYDWITSTGYSDADVDTHLNTATATTGQVLSWDGADYDWTTPAGGSSTLTIDNKTGAYTVVSGDLGKIINCTANSFTVSLTAAATLGAGFNCWIWNTSATASHEITIDPSGSETIDGRTTLSLRRGEGMQIVCDGTNWQTGDKKVMRGYAENLASNIARPIASGDRAISIAYDSQATATDSLALGSGARATALATTAIGLNSGQNGSQAVTGAGAMALGGSYASGADSFAAAIANNTSSYGATGANSVAVGKLAKAASTSAVALGESCSANSAYSIAMGLQSTASATSAAAIGRSCQASAQRALATGCESLAARRGKHAHAEGMFAAVGDAQYGLMVIKAETTNATPTALTTASSDSIILPNSSAYAFSGLIVARQQAADGTASAAWKVEGLIRREANAASTTLVASTVTAIDNTPAWTLALSADTTNGGLKVEATGAASTDIRWVATIQTSEVTYA